jgi:hypothetical protein
VHLVMQPLNAQSQKNETWQAGQDRRRLDVAKENCPNIGPLGISTGFAEFLEDVKVHLVVQPQNARSQQNQIWQVGQNIRRLEAANEKGQQMGPSSASCDAATEYTVPVL